MITANLADGRQLNFPDGTEQAVIQRTVKQMIGVKDEPTDNSVSPVSNPLGVVDTRGSEFLEPVATMVTGAIAEPIAGLAGIAQSLNPFAKEGAGVEAIEKTREALTYKPRTDKGKDYLNKTGEFLAPVGKLLSSVETKLGDMAFESTGSPTVAAAATTIPTAVIELLGIGAGPKAVRAVRQSKNMLSKGKIAREIADAAPSIEQLKGTARGIYKEIDDAGAIVKPEAYNTLVNNIVKETKSAGLDKTITPKATQAVNRFVEKIGDSVTVSELDTLRKVAQNAAKAIEPAEKALGVRMIGLVDDFLDSAGANALGSASPGANISGIGKKYKVARGLWGRARKSELLQESFEKARNQASGFENGVRTQFRSILNNKKYSKLFTPDERDAMKLVVRGDKKQNFAKLIGRRGFSEGGAMNIVGGALGATAGGVMFGAPGAVIVPLVGQVSRKLAQRMTAKGADFADQVIRAGKDANKIAEVYIKNTPKKLRSAEELSELLTRPDITLDALSDTFLGSSAKELALKRRAQLGGALTATIPTNTGEQR